MPKPLTIVAIFQANPGREEELAGALADFAPQVLFCVKFEDRPYPRDAVMACPSI